LLWGAFSLRTPNEREGIAAEPVGIAVVMWSGGFRFGFTVF
jgi:hypothetical protein